ncbi:MAG: ATP-binding protein [Phycisphaerales bacterium]|nr:ATP-binding protein [Phycisphaerales bacterium]
MAAVADSETPVCDNAVYDAIAPYLVQHILSFAPPAVQDISDFDYIQSTRLHTRCALLDACPRYQASGEARADLGPAESEILQFAFDDPDTCLLALVGPLGCGKTTTLRYLINQYLKQRAQVAYVDFHAAQPPSPSPAPTPDEQTWQIAAPLDTLGFQRRLCDEISRFVTHEDKLPLRTQATRMWDWANSVRPELGAHPAAAIMQRVWDHLPPDASADVVAVPLDVRVATIRRFLSAVLVEDRLLYYILCLDYFVSHHYSGDSRSVVFVFDNLDPLPWAFHTTALDIATWITTNARCKVIIAMRPLTYTSSYATLQGGAGTTVFFYVEHCGPSLEHLLRSRLNNHILGLTDAELSTRLNRCFSSHDQKHGGLRRIITAPDTHEPALAIGHKAIPLSCVRRWLTATRDTLFEPGRTRDVLAGVAGGSLRTGMLLYDKVVRGPANVVRLEKTLGIAGRKPRQILAEGTLYDLLPAPDEGVAEALPHRAAVRAMLLQNHQHFRPNERRIFDNLFSTACAQAGSLTCKLRILHYLKQAGREPIQLRELLSWLSCFGYRERTIVHALNHMLADARRLICCDTVRVVATPIQPQMNALLCISAIGRFCADSLAQNIDYIQEMIPSSDVGLSLSDEGDVARRMADVRHFLDALFDQDKLEVGHALLRSCGAQYTHVYGRSMFSADIMFAAWRSAQRILDARRLDGVGVELQGAAYAELVNWRDFSIPRVREGVKDIKGGLPS